jgi:hypothetical protein
LASKFAKSVDMTAKNGHKIQWISKLLNKGLPQKKVRGPKLLHTVLKEKNPHGSYSFMIIYFYLETFWQLFFNRF